MRNSEAVCVCVCVVWMGGWVDVWGWKWGDSVYHKQLGTYKTIRICCIMM